MKIIRLLSVLLLLVTALSLSCCATVEEEGAVTVIVEDGGGTRTVYRAELGDVKNKDDGAFGVLEYLSELDEGSLYLETESGAYGKYITKIGVLENGRDNKYIMVYTSNEKDFGTWDGVKSLEHEGVTMTESGVGVSSMSIEDGTVILFRAERSEW